MLGDRAGICMKGRGKETELEAGQAGRADRLETQADCRVETASNTDIA